MPLLTGAKSNKQPSESVRAAIRTLLTNCPEYLALDSSTRLTLAQGLVRICAAALDLASETEAASKTAPQPPPLAQTQSAASEFSGVAAQRLAETTKQVLNAVSFPRFVTELINGVFKALVDTNQQQMQSYVELIRNVAASTEGFANANVGLDGARRWLMERFPGVFVMEGDEESWGDEQSQLASPEEQAEQAAEIRLRLGPGAAMPSEGMLRLGLGLGPQDSLPGGDPERLVPLARMALARNRQQMLATMVMLGMQRIVIESGRLHASMRFHVDTRSAAQSDAGSQFDFHNNISASGKFGFGPWGASASMTNTIGYVSTQKTQTTEEMNTDLNLDSSVELVFKTDYLPLDRLAGREQTDRIKINTLNPEAERKADAEVRSAREKRIGESDANRRDSIEKSISSTPADISPKPGTRSIEATQKAPEDAAKKEPATKPVSSPDSSKTERKEPDKKTHQDEAKKEKIPSKEPVASGSDKNENKEPAKKNISKQLQNQSIILNLDQTKYDLKSNTETCKPDVVFVPTPQQVIDEMLELVKLHPDETLYDLGCGDGRIIVAAAKKYGCRAVGFDIDPRRVAESVANVKINNLTHLATVEQRDIFSVDLSSADVVTVYLLPGLNIRLIPQFEKMKHGSRIVSHDFNMEGIIPDRVVQIYLPDRHMYKTCYLWITPLKKSIIPARNEWADTKGLTV